LDQAGFDSIEFYVPVVQLKKMVQDLQENPWHWLELGTSLAKKTVLRLHGHGQGLSHMHKSIDDLLGQKVVERGVTVVRTSISPWNDYDEIKDDVADLQNMGMKVVLNLIYSVSPRHTDEYFVSRAKGAAALKPYRICFKDVGGLLKPERVRELMPKILPAIGNIPLELHAHSTNSLSLLNVMEAVKHGVRYIHTAVPPLASGTSQPSVFSVARNLKELGYVVDVDLSALEAVKEHFTYIAKQENLPVGELMEYDERLYKHQVPGGMMGTLRFHLKQVGAKHSLDEVLDEVVRVRTDFGYPIMVTPLSQFVGTQSVLNVATGEQYKMVPDEVIHYALGHWGKEAIEVMDPKVRAKILDRPRARELEKWTPPRRSLDELRKEFGQGLTDEELILRMYVNEEAVKIARQAPIPKPFFTPAIPQFKEP
jgi:oxaloacetate decarboxylase (Na+ extruding) subunit alpha